MLHKKRQPILGHIGGIGTPMSRLTFNEAPFGRIVSAGSVPKGLPVDGLLMRCKYTTYL
jgi:hypothetical protein